MTGPIEICFSRLLLITMSWRPFRARRPGGRFPGLKPWANFCSPSGAINYPKSCLSSRHSTLPFIFAESLNLFFYPAFDHGNPRLGNLALKTHFDHTIFRQLPNVLDQLLVWLSLSYGKEFRLLSGVFRHQGIVLSQFIPRPVNVRPVGQEQQQPPAILQTPARF